MIKQSNRYLDKTPVLLCVLFASAHDKFRLLPFHNFPFAFLLSENLD